MIPVGADTCLNSYENKDDAYVKFKGDKTRFEAYLEECSQIGFTVDTELNGNNYDAYNKDGYRVHIVCFTSEEKDPFITVNIDKPKTNGDLRWPTQGAATILPDPKKNEGKYFGRQQYSISSVCGRDGQRRIRRLRRTMYEKGLHC